MAGTPVRDGHVVRALRAYEALPPLAGLEARMRAALESVIRKKPAPEPEAPAEEETRLWE